MEEYRKSAPELYEQHRRLAAIVDGYRWGVDYSDESRALAEFFRAHPDIHTRALALGKKLAALADVDEDDPCVDELASEAADMVASVPELAGLLDREPGIGGSFSGAFDQLVECERPPAQCRYSRLFHAYLRENRERADGATVGTDDQDDGARSSSVRNHSGKEHL